VHNSILTQNRFSRFSALTVLFALEDVPKEATHEYILCSNYREIRRVVSLLKSSETTCVSSLRERQEGG